MMPFSGGKVHEKKMTRYFAKYLEHSSMGTLWVKALQVGWRGMYPTRPEIDIMWGSKRGLDRCPPVTAAEIKYFSAPFERVPSPPPYYSGVDEALALLLFGIDHSVLIHLVDSHLMGSYLRSLEVTRLMIKSLHLPIGYRVYKIIRRDDNVVFKTKALVGEQLMDLEKLWIDPPPNPSLDVPQVQKNREVLFKQLRISKFC